MRATRDHKGFKITDDATGNEFCFRHPSFVKYQSILGTYNQKYESAKTITNSTEKNTVLAEAMTSLVSSLMKGWKVTTDDEDIAKEFGVTVPANGSVELPFVREKIGEAITSPSFSELFDLFMEEANPKLSPNSESPAPSA